MTTNQFERFSKVIIVYWENHTKQTYAMWRKTEFLIVRIGCLYSYQHALSGAGSVVGIKTDYGLDGPGIESRRGEIFRTFPELSSLLYNGYQVFPGGKERSDRDADPSPPSSAVVMKE
jgi:hypothetical protein